MKSAYEALRHIVRRRRLAQLRRAGLQTLDDSLLFAARMPSFGSEPYLISIGRRVQFAGYVIFFTHDGAASLQFNDPSFGHDGHVRKFGRITVHEDCFIGHGVILLPGVTIGKNSIVGVGSVVYRDVPPNTVVCGNPAKPVMTTSAYRDYCKLMNHTYDEERYRCDKRQELLRLYPYPW